MKRKPAKNAIVATTSRRKRPSKRGKLLASALVVVTLIVWIGLFGSSQTTVAVRLYGYEVVNEYPHDPDAFTQGLLYRDGLLYESTGLNGTSLSSLRRVRLETGEVIDEREVGSELFAEGLTDWDDSLIQLTWHAGVGFVYDIRDFSVQRTFRYPGEGWGLARYGDRLVMSDGTPELRFLDPATLGEVGRVTVTEAGMPVNNLNELEEVNGQILANIWLTDQLVIIDPQSGEVVGRVDLEGLLTPAERSRGVDVLNGIAHDAASDRLFVTGKLWPKLFEIRLTPR